MNLDELTLRQVKQLQHLLNDRESNEPIASENIGKFVVVRTYSAGVHMGILEKHNGKAVTLSNARRLWRWKGANSLNEVSLKGVDTGYSRISEPVSSIELTEAIEILPCTDVAKTDLSNSRWPS